MDGVQTLIVKAGRRPCRCSHFFDNAEKFLRKISVFGAAGCQILMLKCTKFDFCWGSAQDPAGELTALPQTS